MPSEGYLARSARTVFGDPSWLWRSAVLGVVTAIPIAGPVFATGYGMVLMRDGVWGVGRGLPHFSESSEIWRQGWRGFVVSLVWSLILIPALVVLTFGGLAVALIVGRATDRQLAAQVFGLSFTVVTLMLTGIVRIPLSVALLRSAVYVNIESGLSISEIRVLVRRHKAGFWRVTGLMLAVFALGGAVGLVPTLLRFALHLSSGVGLVLAFAWTVPVSVLFAPLHLVVQAAYGLWGRETDVDTWPPSYRPDTSAPVQQALRADAVS